LALHPIALSVDVEAWTSATILQETGRIFKPETAVVEHAERLLELMADAGARATWFFLGEVAERFPGLVRRVAEAGHELGVHGFHHHQVSALGPGRFRASVQRAKQVVEAAGGCEAPGFRAVDFSIGVGTEWALDELLDAGFRWDASLFPMKRPRYGAAGAPLHPHWANTPVGRRIFRVPVAVFAAGGIRVPFAGGGYFRLLPYAAISAMSRHTLKQGPACFYFHPVEVAEGDGLPELPEELSSQERALVFERHRQQQRGRGPAKIRRLLAEFRARPIGDVIRPQLGEATF
jgi:polysaccharide deacetylase family protein (PEP-CTERM system associated)